jgi:hypothetical protein
MDQILEKLFINKYEGIIYNVKNIIIISFLAENPSFRVVSDYEEQSCLPQ